MSPQCHHQTLPQWVASPELTDVLFGRGHRVNRHPGNKLFRKLINKRKNEYNGTKSRQIKSKIAKEIVDFLVRAEKSPPRFLRKAAAQECLFLGIPKGAWCVVDEERILDKTKQAFRRKRMKKDETSIGNQGLSDKHNSVATAAEKEAIESLEASNRYKQSQLQADELLNHQDHLSNKPFVTPTATEEEQSLVKRQDHPSQNSFLATTATQPTDKHAIQFREVTSRKDAFVGSRCNTNMPSYQVARACPATIHKTNDDTTNTKRHGGKFKRTAQESVVSPRAAKRNSPTFLQKDTTSNTFLLGAPTGAWIETSVLQDATKEGRHDKATSLLSSHNESRNQSCSSSTLFHGQLARTPQELMQMTQGDTENNLPIQLSRLLPDSYLSYERRVFQDTKQAPEDPRGKSLLRDDQDLAWNTFTSPMIQSHEQMASVSPYTVNPAASQWDLLMQEPLPPDPYLPSETQLYETTKHSFENPQSKSILDDLVRNHSAIQQVATVSQETVHPCSEAQLDILMQKPLSPDTSLDECTIMLQTPAMISPETALSPESQWNLLMQEPLPPDSLFL